MYSNPPVNGARIASTVMGDAALRAEWLGEVEDMASRIVGMRTSLKSNLEGFGAFLRTNMQCGAFSRAPLRLF